MHYRTRRLSLMVAGAVLAGLTAKASAQYAVTTDVAVPFYSGDGLTGSLGLNSTSSASAFVKYTSMSLASQFSVSSNPNGNYTSTMVGTLTGSLVSNSSVGVSTGWAYDPTYGFRLIGLVTESSTGAHSAPSTITGVSSAGIIGASPQASSITGTSIGQLAWYDPNSSTTNGSVQLGLTGTNFGFTYQSSTGAVLGNFQSSSASFVNGSGIVVGTTQRYAGVEGNNDAYATNGYQPSSNQNLGTSAWIKNGAGSPTEIGLGVLSTDTAHYYPASGTVNTGYAQVGYTGTFYVNNVSGLNANGDVIGSATNYANATSSSLGTDGWVYNGSAGASATTTPVGLYYSALTPTVSGFASIPFAYGNQVTAGTQTLLNTARTSSLKAISTSGQIAGTAGYYNTSGTSTSAVGTDAFVYTPSTGNYVTLGFTSNSFTSFIATGYPITAGLTSFVNLAGGRSSSIAAMNDHNLVAGTSNTYVGVGSTPSNYKYVDQGSAAWISNTSGGTPTQIGLWNQNTTVHVGPLTASDTYGASGVYKDTITALTQSGFVAGVASRYSSTDTGLGSDAWVYNPYTGTTSPVDPDALMTSYNTTYLASTISYISETGIAVGEYERSSSGPFYAFIWSPTGGPNGTFSDLGSNVPAGLSASGYQTLIDSYYTDGLGSSLYATASANNAPSTINALVTLSGTAPVPEPTALSLLSVGGLALLRRRRRGSVNA